MKIFATLFLSLFCFVASGANVRLYFQSNTNSSTLDTNDLIATPISSNIRADGGVVARGIPVRIANPTGVVTQSFNLGWYAVSNRALARGIVINVFDSYSTVYDLTNVLESGFNTYVKTVYGTNPPPTFNETTNALGFLPLTPTQGTNAWTAADTVVSNALSARLIATNDILFSLIQTATNTGITAATATNISAYQALLATNGFRTTATNIARAISSTNNTSGSAASATNLLYGGYLGRVGYMRVVEPTEGSVALVSESSQTNIIFNWVDGAGTYIPSLGVGAISGNGSSLYSVSTTNITGAALVAVTNAAITQSAVSSNGLSARLIATNTSIRSDFASADTVVSNGAVAAAVANGTVVSNGLSARLLATNTAIRSDFATADTATSNGLSTRLINTNASLISQFGAADTVVSNAAIAYATAATNFALRAVAQGTNIILTTNGVGVVTINSTSTTGSQTPWTSDVDAATYSLANSAKIDADVFYSEQPGTRSNNFVAGDIRNSLPQYSVGGVVIGGLNSISGWQPNSSIVGGISNTISGASNTTYGASQGNNIIGGGRFNVITNNDSGGSVIGGGLNNAISIIDSVGTGNAVIGGGTLNTNKTANSVIGGGRLNRIETSGGGQFGTIPGGVENVAAAYSFAAGSGAYSTNVGGFVWADSGASASSPFGTTADNQFLVKASGGVAVNTNNPSGNALKVVGTSATDNLKFGRRPVVTYTTNAIAVISAGTSAANGTYEWTGGRYLNAITSAVITNNTGSNWQIRNSSGTVLYSATGAPAETSYVVQSGAANAPTTYYGTTEQHNGTVLQGIVTSTNLDARFTVSAAAVATNDSRLINLAASPAVISTNFVGNGANLTNVTLATMATNSYGAISILADSTNNLAISGTYYILTNFTALPSYLFTTTGAASGYLTNTLAGFYKINIAASFNGSGGGGDAFEFSVFTNSAECNTIEFIRKTASTDTGSGSAVGTVYLPANSSISMRVKNTGSTGTIVIKKAQVVVSALNSDSVPNNITGNAATATTAANLDATYFWSTNTVDDKSVLYATGGGDVPAALKGIYRLQWSNLVTTATSYRFQGCYTNTASTNIIAVNYELPDPAYIFVITSGSNSPNMIYSYLQGSEHASSGRAWFLSNPYDVAEGAFSGVGEITLTWGTNSVSTNSTRFLGTGLTTVFPQHVPTNSLVVSLQGDDGLANRTNGYPFKTVWAANQAAQWGDYIYIEPGYHRTYGIHMKRGVTIGGAGRNTVIEPMSDTDLNHATYFQAQLISLWDNCTVENLTITNGAIGFTQHEGTVLGGTNSLARNLWIYPAYLPQYYDELIATQTGYYGVGVKFSRLGTDVRCERVRVYSSGFGFSFQSSVNSSLAASRFDLIDCEAECDPRYLGTNNYWLGSAMTGFVSTNIGGMIPISFALGDRSQSFNYAPITVNIHGGRFVSMNGATNLPNYVGGENNVSRNAGIWFARGHTNFITVNLSGNPEFILGNTNTSVQFILNETTNNRVTVSGLAQVKYVANGNINDAGTNTVELRNSQLVGDGGGLTNLLASQSVYAAGTVATSTATTNTMDFGTTDPSLTISSAGTYLISAAAQGIHDPTGGPTVIMLVCSNSTPVLSRSMAADATATGFFPPWFLAVPTGACYLQAGDTLSLKWYCSAGGNYQAASAEIVAVKIR